MRPIRLTRLVLVLSILSICGSVPYTALAKTNDDKPLRQRFVPPKQLSIETGKNVYLDRLRLKFVEGSRVRLREEHFKMDPSTFTDAESALLARVQLSAEAVELQLASVNALVDAVPGLKPQPALDAEEQQLEALRQTAQLNSGEEIADLNLYYDVRTGAAKLADVLALANGLNALPIVERVEFAPIPVELDGGGASTPDFTGSQGYLDAAPSGIDARYAWSQGASGDSVRIGVVDRGW